METFTSNEQTLTKSINERNANHNKSSRGALYNNQQYEKSVIAEHDNRLRTVLIDACEDAGVPDGIRNEIVENGILRFVIDKENNVKSISPWKDVNQYVQHHKDAAPSTVKSALEIADEREMKKQELFDQLAYYSKIGDMKGYRTARAAYAEL